MQIDKLCNIKENSDIILSLLSEQQLNVFVSSDMLKQSLLKPVHLHIVPELHNDYVMLPCSKQVLATMTRVKVFSSARINTLWVSSTVKVNCAFH